MRKLLLAALLLFPLAAHAGWTIRFTGTAANAVPNGSAGTGDIVPTLGGTTNAGDIIACGVNQRSSVNHTAISSSGYTLVHGKNGNTSPSAALLLKIAAGGDANPTITTSDVTTNRTLIGQCAVFEGGPATLTGIKAHYGDTTNGSQEDVDTAAVTITTANTLVIAVGGKNNDWETQDVLQPSGFTELGQPERSASAQVGLVWGYQIQTTAANISAGIFDGQTGNFAAGVSFTVSLLSGAVAPTFTVGQEPAIGTRTTSTIPVTATTACTDCTMHGVALADAGSATCAEIDGETATGAYKYFHQAMTADAQGTGTFSTYTDGTVRDGKFCLESVAGGYSAVASIADMYKTAAFSVTPSVTAQGTGDYTITKTLDGPGSCGAVAVRKDETAPTVAQVLAGNGTGDVAALAAVTDASCEAGTMTLGSSLTRPVHDVYVAGTYGSQPSGLTTLADEMLDAPTGYQYDLLTSVSATSPCKELNDIPISPTIAAADVIKTTTTVSPGGEALTTGADCEMQYTDSNGTRRTTTLAAYDTSVGDWMSGGPTTIYFNNAPPTCTAADCLYDTGTTFLNGEVLDAIDLTGLFADAESDALVITTSDTGTGTGADKRPAGTTITSGSWTGTPSCASGNTSGSFTVTATDVANDTETVDVTWTCYDQVVVPNCYSPAVTMASCGASLEALNLTPNATLVYDSGTAVGFVKTTSPAAGASVNPFTTVTMTVSLGSGASGRRRTMGLGVGVGRFTPEVPTDGVFDDQFFLKFKWRF